MITLNLKMFVTKNKKITNKYYKMYNIIFNRIYKIYEKISIMYNTKIVLHKCIKYSIKFYFLFLVSFQYLMHT